MTSVETVVTSVARRVERDGARDKKGPTAPKDRPIGLLNGDKRRATLEDDAA
jgi:hypothetical protein